MRPHISVWLRLGALLLSSLDLIFLIKSVLSRLLSLCSGILTTFQQMLPLFQLLELLLLSLSFKLLLQLLLCLFVDLSFKLLNFFLFGALSFEGLLFFNHCLELGTLWDCVLVSELIDSCESLALRTGFYPSLVAESCCRVRCCAWVAGTLAALASWNILVFLDDQLAGLSLASLKTLVANEWKSLCRMSNVRELRHRHV
jgi:hypothetical protein